MSLLDWEESLFNAAKALHRRLVSTPRERAAATVRVRLADVRAPLFLLAQMIAERPVTLFETDNRLLCDRERIFLPPQLDIAPTREANAALYRLKTVVAGLALRRGGACPAEVPLPEALADELASLPGLSGCLAAAQEALGDEDLWRLFGRPMPSDESPEAEPTARLSGPEEGEETGAVTEIEGKGQTGVRLVEAGDDQPVEAEMPIHTFEKVEAIEEYSGLNRKTDAADELEEHADALRSVDMKHVLRSRERPRSIYRSSMLVDGFALEVDGDGGAGGIPYPEWDYRRRAYRPDWCHVRETHATEADFEWLVSTQRRYCALVLDLKKRFASVANAWLASRRQPYGPELDLDAVVDAEVSRRLGHAPDERFYVDRHRALHDVAALILLDQSFSTESWIDDVRVLDTIRETIFCVGEVLDEFVERFAIAGFSSNTRRECGYHRIKDFGEPWRRVRGRLGRLEAQGYTRIGSVLRHAQEQLMREQAARKIVILVTDGRPCDYDRYEGEYGIRDVKKAIETGRRYGLQTHAFAVDRQAREHFPRMFSRHRYHIVGRPQALVASMCELFFHLQAG